MSTDVLHCSCGRDHQVVRYRHDDPVVECPEVPPGTAYLLDTRTTILNGVRALTGYDGKVWMEAPRG